MQTGATSNRPVDLIVSRNLLTDFATSVSIRASLEWPATVITAHRIAPAWSRNHEPAFVSRSGKGQDGSGPASKLLAHPAIALCEVGWLSLRDWSRTAALAVRLDGRRCVITV